jgi:hypothetical protein
MSGINLDVHLIETAIKIVTTLNEDGDVNYGATSSSACLYRDISMLNRVQNRQEVTIDGLLWFAATENVQRGDIYNHPDEGYLRIEKVTRAKRLVGDGTTQFIKCEVTKQRQVS